MPMSGTRGGAGGEESGGEGAASEELGTDSARPLEQGYHEPPGTFIGLDAGDLRALGAVLLMISMILFFAGIGILPSGPAMPHGSLDRPFEECAQQRDAWFQASQDDALAGFAVFAVGMVIFAVGDAALRFAFGK